VDGTAGASYRFGAPEAVETLEELQQSMEQVAEEERAFRERLRSLEHALAQKCGKDGEDYGHRKSQLRSLVEDAAMAVDVLRDQRKAILCGDDPKVREEQQKRDDIKQFKASKDYATEEQLDERIRELETLMYETNLQIDEERKLLAEIQNLGRQKLEVEQNRLMEKALRPEEDIVRERLVETAGQLAAKVEELRRAEDDLKRLEEEREETLASSPEAAERAMVHHQLNECLQRKNRLQSKIQLKERVLARQKADEEEERRRQAEKEEEQQRRRERTERLQQLREERERERREAQERGEIPAPRATSHQARPSQPPLPDLPQEPPRFAEFRLLQQTLAYCRKLLPKDNEAEKERKPVEYNNPEGSLVIVPKEQRTEEFLFVPPKPRRHEGKVRKRPPTSKMKKTRTEGKQVLLHTPLSLSLFAELKIVPPVNTCDVPLTVDEVEERLEAIRKEAAQWEEKKKELQAQRLAEGLEKARLAQEEREKERRWRLEAALSRMEEQLVEVEAGGPEEDQQWHLEALRRSVATAAGLGATEPSLANAKAALRAADRRNAEADLRSAVERVEEAREVSARAREVAKEECAENGATDLPESRLEESSRNLRAATKALESCLRQSRQADVSPELLDAANKCLEAGSEKASGGGSDQPDVASHDEVPEEDVQEDEGATVEAEEDDFVPAIVNLGDDDEEELVFDLGMG